MEMDQFDTFTRRLSAAGPHRRQALRALGSLLLGGVAGKFDPITAGAKGKRAGRRREERKHQGQLQGEGKHHKKHKHKNKDKDKDKEKPEKPQPCSTGFRLCGDGSCVADKPGICCIDEEFCPGGGCRSKDGCCSGDRQCYGTTTCVGPTECCPGEKKCADGECYPQDGCCPEEKECGGDCIPKDECCQLTYPLCDHGCNFIQCFDGEWECHPRPFGDYCLMPWYDPGICCNGECRPRDFCERDGGHYDPNMCICIKQ